MERKQRIRAAANEVSGRDAKLALAHIGIQAMEAVAFGMILRLDSERFERVLVVLRGFRKTELGIAQRRREYARQQRMYRQGIRRDRPGVVA